jgi:hypothetical protein
MLSLSEDETGYAREDAVDLLENVAEEKLRITRDIDYLDERFLEGFDAVKGEMGVRSLDEASPQDLARYPALAGLKRRTDEILGLMRQVRALDEKTQEGVRRLREGLAQDIVRLRKQKHVHSIYMHERPPAKARGAAAEATRPAARRLPFDQKK